MDQSRKPGKPTSSIDTLFTNEGFPKTPDTGKDTDLDAHELFQNRELSHVKFNLRVLSQAKNNEYPILERLNFLTIFSSNLDEFYEIRVAGLKKQTGFGRQRPGADGKHAEQVLEEIHEEVRFGLNKQYHILNKELLPALARENIHFLQQQDWDSNVQNWARDYFLSEVLPVISPLGLDPAHPFPRLVNKSLNFILSLEGKDAFGRESGLAVVPAPRSLPRLIKLPGEVAPHGDNFIFLSSIIHAYVDEFFPGMRVKGCYQFRVTRNSDLDLGDLDGEDYASALMGELHSRRFGTATKLEVELNCPDNLSDFLLARFNLCESELFRVDGPVNLQRMAEIQNMLSRNDLKFPKFVPNIPPSLQIGNSIFSSVSKEDQLLLHPFQSFVPVIDWVREAAADPTVVSIKQTLYRTNESSELVAALAEAARCGTEVTVVIELTARFDEEENINFANILQEAGAVVVYGVMGYKTHAKMLLFVRRENGLLKRYVHLGTGNYHLKNSALYTDYSLLTADEILCSDVHKVFQQITGMGKKIHPRLLINAPFNLRISLLNMISAERAAATEGKPARIIAKLNALTDPELIKALYAASMAGVKIDLIVRGMCCLRPQVPGISDNIQVISVIGRFLEHSRVYYFQNSQPNVFCSSADWMERNLSSRIEVCFPILKRTHASRILEELSLYLRDEVQKWTLTESGNYISENENYKYSDGVQNKLLEILDHR